MLSSLNSHSVRNEVIQKRQTKNVFYKISDFIQKFGVSNHLSSNATSLSGNSLTARFLELSKL